MADPDAVTVGYVCDNEVVYSFHESLLQLVAYDSQVNQRVMRGGYAGQRYGAGGLVEARNKMVRTFLEEDRADWLWMVDTDMGFYPDTVDRLFEAADPVERPIVGALCFFPKEVAADGMGGYRQTVTPTVYDWVNVDGQYGWAVRWKYPVNTLVRCGATGAACVLVHRSVFEKVEAEHGQVWYDRIPNVTTGGALIGEDMSFCLRAGALNVPIYVHTGVPTTHFKQVWLGEEDYWRDVALKSAAERIVDMADDPAFADAAS